MGYIKVAYQKILRKMDESSYLPNGWNEFVDKYKINHNLIIKGRNNKCYCTNCHHNFKSKKKVMEEIKCPICHNKYLIKRSNLRYYEFKDYLSILERVDNEFIIRYFELKTIIDAQHETHSSVVEFAREIPTLDFYGEVFVNERVSRCQCHIYINHSDYYSDDIWRKYTRNYSLIDYSIVFPNNIKKVFKNTEYQYSCIWEIAKHCDYIDLPKLMTNVGSLPKVEMLTKLKLYNLALSDKISYIKGTFNEIFGVPKDYYGFMKRHNITYTQLKLLKLLKEPNINKIRYLQNFLDLWEYTDDLEEISNYISMNKLIQYCKMHRSKVDIGIYKDYLRFASLLGLDLKNKRYIFPKNLKEEHDKLEKQVEVQNNKLISNGITRRAKTLSKNTYKNNQYIIMPAKTFKALQNESKQQHNCVRTYAEKYASGTCDIYFMRDVKEQNKSLVTVEVKHNRVVQSRIKYNYSPNEVQNAFLKEWEKNVLQNVA